MKGFPNQVSNLITLSNALAILQELLDAGKNPKDDGVYGETLVRAGVLSTGHKPIPIEDYLAKQKAIPKEGDQSLRTRPRGLRELFRILSLTTEHDGVELTNLGRLVVEARADALTPALLRAWRTAILQMTHDGKDGVSSHPYQVLLRLVANRPGISRAKCALALEAKDDSDGELERITKLSDLEEDKIREAIGVEETNWDNAKKILPRFAEQLGDVFKVKGNFYLAESPGAKAKSLPPSYDEEDIEDDESTTPEPTTQPVTRKPSSVTPQTIATTRLEDEFDETLDAEPVADPDKKLEQKAKLTARFNRHQAIVKKAATMLASKKASLFESPFDCLALFTRKGLLLEVKSLSGTREDEVDRVREALSQLLYYESFAIKSLTEEHHIKKVACFEKQITDEHVAWLEKSDISVIWCDEEGDGFKANPDTTTDLSGYFDLK